MFDKNYTINESHKFIDIKKMLFIFLYKYNNKFYFAYIKGRLKEGTKISLYFNFSLRNTDKINKEKL